MQFSALINKTIGECCSAARRSCVLCAVEVWLPPLPCGSAPYCTTKYIRGRWGKGKGGHFSERRCGEQSDAKR